MNAEQSALAEIPIRPSELVLIRHAESARNLAKKGNIYFLDDESRRAVQGIPDHDIPITEKGWNQARATGRALRERLGAPDYLYDSGYCRTIQTAEGMLEAFGPEERAAIRQRHNLFIRERDPGYCYDMTTREAQMAFPWLQDYWETFGSFYSRPPGGQSLADLATQVYLFLAMLFRDRPGQKVWVVTHGGTLRCFRFLLEHWNYEDAANRLKPDPPKNCSVTIYRADMALEHLKLMEYNTLYHEPDPSQAAL